MKVLFLDFDGVLNLWPSPQRDGKFDKEACINLEYLLIKVPDLKIVVSSAWRIWGLDSVRETLKQNGIDPRKVIDITGDEQTEDKKSHRGYQVQCWLDKHKEVTHFVVFDDESDFDNMKDKLVRIARFKGITQANVEKAIEILEK